MIDLKKTILDYTKKKIKNAMSDPKENGKSDKAKHADTIIRNHIAWSMGASFLVPIPIADIFAVGALQLDMIRQLCRAYGVPFSETQGKAIVSALTSSTLARAGARSLIKLVPGLGTLIGGITVSIFNGASTYALGEVFKRHFETGGTILDFDVEGLKNMYKEKFEKGKEVAKDMKHEITDQEEPKNTPDLVDKLKDLAALKEKGVLTEEEFTEMKKKLFN
ncbi:MAG: hypothetical protein RLZZ248_77 [Bacteroidota bacterium]|jgi:uncharacterized protein (DUF697 family)